MIRFFASAFLFLTLFTACTYMGGKKIRGNGNVVTQAKTFSGFTEVEVGSAIHLYVKQDSAFSVKVEVDENLQQYIIIEQDGGTLRIKQKNNTSLDATGSIKVYVSAPLFKRLEASGACKIIGENLLGATDEISLDINGASEGDFELKAPKVIADISGASNLKLRGKTKDFFLEGSGASHAKCFELLAENADVDVAGASSADVFASVSLKADASGASDIRYKGARSRPSDFQSLRF